MAYAEVSQPLKKHGATPSRPRAYDELLQFSAEQRKRFATIDHVILLRAVNAFRPWQAAVGTSNGITKVFDDIAAHCEADPSFKVVKRGPAIKTRFTALLKQFNINQCQSMRNQVPPRSIMSEKYSYRIYRLR